MVNPPRGMRDFPPREKQTREQVLAVIREQFSRYGYQEIETPAVEDLGRLASSDGGENEKLIFRILRRNLNPGAGPASVADLASACDLGLRFDLTVPLARFYATHRAQLPEVFRSIQIGPVWRAERPQRGRFRQFTQCDLDVVGEPGPLAEMELITATLRTLNALGLTGCRVRLNDRRLLVGMLARCGFPLEAHGRVLIAVDKLDKIGIAGVEAELERAGHPRAQVEPLLEALKQPADAAGPDPASPEPGGAAEDLQAIRAAVEAVAGAGSVRLDPTLVRGMGYYTGPIFEIEQPDSPGSIAGGGRYDGMIGRFAGADVPACGFSIGFERILDLLTPAPAAGARQLALVHAPDVDPARLLRVQARYLDDGWSVRLVRTTRRLNRLLETLREDGFTQFAVLDPDSDGGDELLLRDLR